jgi:V8-like Glu-specific endopeptidase
MAAALASRRLLIAISVVGLGVLAATTAAGSAERPPEPPLAPAEVPPPLPGRGAGPPPTIPAFGPTPPVPKCTLAGTSAADVLRGTSGADVICGRGGNDLIYAGGGDVILAGAGNDRIAARNGKPDVVSGGPGRDRGGFDAQIDTVTGVESTPGFRAVSNTGALGNARWAQPQGQSAPGGIMDTPNQSAFAITSSGWYRHKFVGQITFDKPNGLQGSCTGTLVAVNIVITAAHCVYDTEFGVFNSNFTFAPNQWGTNQPYGAWSAPIATVRTEYQQTGAGIFDFAFLKLTPDAGGRDLGTVLGGWMGVTTNYQGEWFWSIGYPGGGWFAQYSGYPYFCYSKLGAYSTHAHAGTNWYELGIGCFMTGGASGGPWLVDLDRNNAWNYVASVNSHCWPPGCPRGEGESGGYSRNLWGPYLTQTALDLMEYTKGL